MAGQREARAGASGPDATDARAGTYSWRGRPGNCKMFSSIRGLYPLTPRAAHAPDVTTKNVLLHC